MKFLIIFYFLIGSCGLCLSKRSGEHSNPRVITPLGTIEGFYNTSYGGRRYEAYKGIPFAHPPIGELRFAVPKTISPWTGVLMAKQFGLQCMQYNYVLPKSAYKVSGSEDCLYLNVYTPVLDHSYSEGNRTSTDLLPVIFFIPGGAFQIGNGNKYGPKYLLDSDVTLVTINYRVGPLGFLSTEDETVSGNMGLKDQVIALRWVKENIKFFGGDPSRITIFGHSAGGVSAHYHYLTNLTRGLFQGGMSLSGTAINAWSIVKNPLEKAQKLATVVGCRTENIRSMVDCLRARPAHQIVDAMSEFVEWVYSPAFGWGPVVEKGGGEFTFIDRLPIDIIDSGDAHDVPWITSVVSEEALYPTSYYIANEEVFGPLNDDWETIAPYLLFYNDTIPKIDQPKVARLIKQHYLGESSMNRTTLNEIVKMIQDPWLFVGFQKATTSQAQVNRSPIHVHYFSYRGAHSFSETLSGTSENFGVCHGDDLAYVLDSFFDPTTTVEDREMQKVLINIWVSFAIDGKPDVGVEWPRLSPSFTDEYRYLHIAGPEKIGMEHAENFGDKNFWQTIEFQENIL